MDPRVGRPHGHQGIEIVFGHHGRVSYMGVVEAAQDMAVFESRRGVHGLHHAQELLQTVRAHKRPQLMMLVMYVHHHLSTRRCGSHGTARRQAKKGYQCLVGL